MQLVVTSTGVVKHATTHEKHRQPLETRRAELTKTRDALLKLLGDCEEPLRGAWAAYAQFHDQLLHALPPPVEVRPFVPPLVRDRKTLRALERPAGPAGTRAWHKRSFHVIPLEIYKNNVDRWRRHRARLDAITRLRTIPWPIINHSAVGHAR